ncbi:MULTISPECIES: outer membrane protein assembly factor BamC [Brachymonas]|uniref:outer membrane protein assembly factor BamC n=1 Tax=Brachymonas TaxID=28219 RepID=UPI002E799D0F|nr:outer membrane protein assembly factor BamC [Brachymonas sp. J145]MEE1652705.1 outer membrane protein assembly factor BamC [Brachymonas sp. J145]
MKNLHKLTLTALAASLLAACSPFAGGTSGIDYKSAERGNALEIPPDLTRLDTSTRYNVPGDASAATFEAQRAVTDKQVGTVQNVATDQIGDVQIKREGNQRWLVVPRKPAQLWNPLKAFWENNGFVLTTDDPRLGVMETDWAENRANIPMDPVRRLLGKAIDSLYSTGELDRYRTRVESNAAGGTNIFITHRGMEEVLTGREKETSTWRSRPNSPELENEMLRRLMVSLGVPQAQADAVVRQQGAAAKTASQQARATVQHDTAAGTLLLQDGTEQAWRRLGLALDRTGYTVESSNPQSGSYLVRYVQPSAERESNPGILTRLFGKSKKDTPKPVRYQVQVQPQAQGSLVRVLNEGGQPVSQAESAPILRVLAEDLRQF